MKNIFLILILSLTLVSTSLFARGDRFNDFARVKYSEPIYEYVYDRSNRQECKEVRYKVRNNNHDDRYYSSNYDDKLGVDTLIGTAAGAIIGSQIGGGNGRVAAQIVGGLLGAKVAHEVRNNYKPNYNNSRYDRDEYSYETRTECYDVPNKHKRKVITGYKNHFVYNGVEHFKISNRPLKRVKITHTIDF